MSKVKTYINGEWKPLSNAKIYADGSFKSLLGEKIYANGQWYDIEAIQYYISVSGLQGRGGATGLSTTVDLFLVDWAVTPYYYQSTDGQVTVYQNTSAASTVYYLLDNDTTYRYAIISEDSWDSAIMGTNSWLYAYQGVDQDGTVTLRLSWQLV